MRSWALPGTHPIGNSMNKFQLITTPLLLCATIGFSTAAYSSDTGDTSGKSENALSEMGKNATEVPGDIVDTVKDAGTGAADTAKSMTEGFGKTTDKGAIQEAPDAGN